MNRVIALVAVIGSMGCIKAPPIVMVDRGTALEQQASGTYDELERRLDQAAIEPKSASMTPEHLEALGIRPSRSVSGAQLTDADRVDVLLVQHCIGEGADGLLAQTPDACRGAADADAIARDVARVNVARHQLWRWMHDQRPDVSSEDMRRAWRTLHVAGVICGAWIQGDDSQWHAKAC
jgi:hypothetical protein